MSTNRPQDVADILEGMSTPTPNEVYEATREYDTNYIAAAAASKAHAGGGGGGSQTVESAEVTATAAQMLNLIAAGKTLVATPGAGKILFPLAMTLAINYNTTPYNSDAADDIQVVLGDPLGASSTMWDLPSIGQTFLSSTQDAVLFLDSTNGTLADQRTGSINVNVGANKPLSLINFGTALTDGDSPVVITTYYVTLTLP